MEALMTSGSRRETRSENLQCKKIGCMSGVFHLLHSPSRKRLTSGKKHEKAVTSSRKSKTSSKTKSLAKTPGTMNECKAIAAPGNLPSSVDFRRFSCDLPRSPTLSPEIRRSKSINSQESHHHRRSPALVARLMGLDDFPAPDAAADKRRKLLGALERCDEDLKALKKVIEAVRVTWDRRKSTEENRGESGCEIGESRPGSGGDGRPKSRAGLSSLDGLDSPIGEKRCLDVNSELPSPVSVLDGAIFSPVRNRSNTLEKGKKHEKAVTSSRKSKTSSKTKSLAKTPGTKIECKAIAAPENRPSGVDFRRFSCDLPRSPTLPPEIRRSKSINSQENHDHRRSPALVARLMGLDDFPAPDAAADKRRKLLGALERCDEDLKALKKVIEAVRVTWDRRKSTEENRGELGCEIGESRPGSGGDGRPKSRAGLSSLDGLDSPIGEKRFLDVNSELPSPVSVLDGAIFSPVRNRSNTLEKAGNGYKKLKDEGMNRPFFERAAAKSLLPQMGHQKGDELFEYFGLMAPKPKGWCRSLLSSSRGMEESVSEVCKEGVGEERWEVRRVGLVLEGNIFGELVEEMVRELGIFHKLCASPFLDACRKRLIF